MDIHLGRGLGLDERGFFQKLVLERRGGWCYEMNGLFAWALRELGFQVNYLAGAVPRVSAGPNAHGNHLVLLVHLPKGDFIADVGFGDGFLEPIPLRAGTYTQNGLAFRLEPGPDERWTVHNHPHGGAATYDFGLEPYALWDFQERCGWLQTSPESGFVRTTVCQRFTPEGIVTLRGAVLKTIGPRGVSQQVLEGETEYRQVLREIFGLQVDTTRLWPWVWARHLDWVGSQETV